MKNKHKSILSCPIVHYNVVFCGWFLTLIVCKPDDITCISPTNKPLLFIFRGRWNSHSFLCRVYPAQCSSPTGTANTSFCLDHLFMIHQTAVKACLSNVLFNYRSVVCYLVLTHGSSSHSSERRKANKDPCLTLISETSVEPIGYHVCHAIVLE